MNFNRHFNLENKHAYLGASKYHWVNYSDEKLTDNYGKHLATLKGTQLHEFAENAISLGIKLPKTQKTLNMYVNDCIGFKMKTEQVLYHSDNCFGTVDAISFKNNVLRIFDLKTGVTPASMKQLEIYAALFCLEYDTNPNDIEIELRLYQSDNVITYAPPKEDILYIMEKIVHFSKVIDNIKKNSL